MRVWSHVVYRIRNGFIFGYFHVFTVCLKTVKIQCFNVLMAGSSADHKHISESKL